MLLLFTYTAKAQKRFKQIIKVGTVESIAYLYRFLPGGSDNGRSYNGQREINALAYKQTLSQLLGVCVRVGHRLYELGCDGLHHVVCHPPAHSTNALRFYW